MRKRVAQWKRKEILRAGGVILKEKWIREPAWRRKDCGYSVDVEYQGKTCMCAGFDPLEAYNTALEVMYEIRDGVLAF